MPSDFEAQLQVHRLGNNTHAVPGNQWYHPLLAGADTLAPLLFERRVYEGVAGVLQALEQDEYARFIQLLLAQGLGRFGDAWRYADICTVLFALSRAIEAEDYLEIGVRRGRSMSMVAAQRPEVNIVGFDMWLADYAGMDNPGPEFVAAELKRIGHRGTVQFVSGDSHQTVPAWFEAHPDAWFDLITVDGDHTELGARADLLTVMQRLRVGGILVFDDIAHPSHKYLLDVWQRTVADRPEFSSFAFLDLGYGVAFAVRRC